MAGINDRHFGVQKAFGVFVNFNTRLQELPVNRSGRMVLHEVFIPSLQQQAHANTSLSSVNKRLPQFAPRQKISVCNHNLMARQANGTSISFFNLSPVEQIVTQKQARTCHPSVAMCVLCIVNPRQVHACCHEGAVSLWEILLPDVSHCLHAPPQLRRSLLNLLHQRSFCADGVIQSGRF